MRRADSVSTHLQHFRFAQSATPTTREPLEPFKFEKNRPAALRLYTPTSNITNTPKSFMKNLNDAITSTYNACLKNIGITKTIIHNDDLCEALNQMPFITKMFTVDNCECILNVYPHDNNRDMCFGILSKDPNYLLSTTRTSVDLLSDRNSIIRAKHLSEAQKWVLYLEALIDCVSSGSFVLIKNSIRLTMNDHTITIPLTRSRQNSLDINVAFKMYHSTNCEKENLLEKIAEQEKQIAELQEKIGKR